MQLSSSNFTFKQESFTSPRFPIYHSLATVYRTPHPPSYLWGLLWLKQKHLVIGCSVVLHATILPQLCQYDLCLQVLFILRALQFQGYILEVEQLQFIHLQIVAVYWLLRNSFSHCINNFAHKKHCIIRNTMFLNNYQENRGLFIYFYILLF